MQQYFFGPETKKLDEIVRMCNIKELSGILELCTIRTLRKITFHLISWCRNFVERKSFRIYAETVPFHKISTPGNETELRYFSQWKLCRRGFLNQERCNKQFIYNTLKNSPAWKKFRVFSYSILIKLLFN